MHAMTCKCPNCRGGSSREFEQSEFENDMSQEFEFEDEYEYENEFEFEGAYESEFENESEFEDEYEYEDEQEDEYEGEYEFEADISGAYGGSPFSEAEEAELAMELLSVTSDAELDEFLGKLFKRAGRGLRKLGRKARKFVRPLGRVLKGVAKKALPFVGGALGSFIPIPGVGTAVGTALGSAVGNALEAELGELELDSEQEQFEMARRFVRIAGTAAKNVAAANPGADPKPAIQTAVVNAARKHLPKLGGSNRSGSWMRRGKTIVLSGV